MGTILYLVLGLVLGGGAMYFYFQKEENKKLLSKESQLLEIKQKTIEAAKNADNKTEFEQIMFDLNELDKFWKIFIRKEPSDKQTVSNFRYFLALNNTKLIMEKHYLILLKSVKAETNL